MSRFLRTSLGVTTALVLLAGCSQTDHQSGTPLPQATDTNTTVTSSAVTTLASPKTAYTTAAAAPTTAKNPAESVIDPGRNLEWTIAGFTTVNNKAVVNLVVKNLNQMDVPAADVPLPVLTLGGSSTATSTAASTTTVTIIPDNKTYRTTGQLDLPLRALASTNLSFAFDVRTASLTNATLTIGNAVFTGNLQAVDNMLPSKTK